MKNIIFFSFSFLIITSSFGQSDSLVFTNGNYITGEIKSMSNGVLVIETDYSDADFTIEWEQISVLFSEQNFFFTLVNGDIVLGKLASDVISSNELTVITEEKGIVKISLNDITDIKTFDDKFLDRINASISLGYSFTKANNLNQFSLTSNLGYTAKTWRSFFNLNVIESTQDNGANTSRLDGNIGVDYFLPRSYFIQTKYTFLSNDEQQLNLRSVASIGWGKHLVKTNKLFWSFGGGIAFNNEDFIPTDQPDRNSSEVFVATEFNVFNAEDLSLLTNIMAYPSLTEKGRLRSDFKFDAKYDLPLDFYVGAGVTVNYDNQPIEGASEIDYVFQTTFGWSW